MTHCSNIIVSVAGQYKVLKIVPAPLQLPPVLCLDPQAWKLAVEQHVLAFHLPHISSPPSLQSPPNLKAALLRLQKGNVTTNWFVLPLSAHLQASRGSPNRLHLSFDLALLLFVQDSLRNSSL